jgi:hypothetical protein
LLHRTEGLGKEYNEQQRRFELEHHPRDFFYSLSTMNEIRKFI